MRLAALFLLFAAPLGAQTVVMKILNFPDNQYYSEPGGGPGGGTQAMNLAIASYCGSWADACIGEGDNMNNTGNSTDVTNVNAWAAAMNTAGKPWITPPGNHDYDDIQNGSGNVTNTRTNVVWQTNVGTPMATQTAIKGNTPGASNANSWLDIGTFGGTHWAAIALEYCPRAATLTWANGVITANPTYKFIITTHDYLTNNATLDDVGNGPFSCSQEGYTSDFNYGQGMWDSLIKLHDDQIRLVLNGHWNPSTNFSNRRRDLGTHGYYVDQVYFDPQSFTNGGNGFVRLLSFNSDGTIRVQTYSPVTTTFMTDAANQFTLAAQNPAVTISSYGLNVRGKRRSLLASGPPAGWTARRAITIDHTKIGSADLTNYPVLVSGTYTYLKTTGNGGEVTNASGFDIEFCADTSCATKLNWEIESWSASTGTVLYWVQVPTVSHTTDTVIYLFDGNSGVTTDQSNKTGTWDTNFKIVTHLPNGTTLTANDSTSNGFNGTLAGATPPSATSGLIDGAALGTGTSGSYIAYTGAQTAVNGASQITVSFWAKTTTAQQALGGPPCGVCLHDSGTTGVFFLSLGGTTAVNNQADFTITNSTPTRVNLTPTLSSIYTDGNWHYFVGTYNGSTMTLYYDGASAGTASQSGVLNTLGAAPHAFQGLSTGNASSNALDEIRISSGIARSASWILADYNSQLSPSTFYSVGAPF